MMASQMITVIHPRSGHDIQIPTAIIDDCAVWAMMNEDERAYCDRLAQSTDDWLSLAAQRIGSFRMGQIILG